MGHPAFASRIAANPLIGEHRITRLTPYLKLMNCVVLLLLNYSNAALTLPRATHHPDPDFLFAIFVIVTALCAAGFAVGFLLARIARTDRHEMASLMFGLGMNNNGTGLVLASMELADHPMVMLPLQRVLLRHGVKDPTPRPPIQFRRTPEQRLRLQGASAAAPILRQPSIYHRPVQPENAGDDFRAFTFLDLTHRAFTQRLQRMMIQPARIIFLHPQNKSFNNCIVNKKSTYL